VVAHTFIWTLPPPTPAPAATRNYHSHYPPPITIGRVKSVLLNPTPEDTGSYTKRLKLSLSVAENLALCKPVADFLLYSSSPKVAWLTHPQNPINSPFKENDFFLRIFSDDPIVPFQGYASSNPPPAK